MAEYLVDLNGADAVRRSGYKSKRPDQQAYELLRKPEIATAVAEGKARQVSEANMSAVRTLEEMRRLAFSNVRRLFDEKGNLRPIHTLSEEDAACIAGVEVVKKNLTSGDGQTDTVIKIRLWDKPRSIEMASKHFGLLIDKVEHSGKLEVEWRS